MVYVWLVHVQTHAISDGEISLSAAYKVEFAFFFFFLSAK
jgi:hypothetical protein